MLTRRVTVSRRARESARLPGHTRPHGRRRGYDHRRSNPLDGASEPRRPPLAAVVMLAGVFTFLLFVIAGAVAPGPGPLVKHEPVSTARVR